MTDLPRIVYFGSDAICLPGLRYLREDANALCTLVGVVSQPDRRQGRGRQLKQNPVAAYASSMGIPLHQPERPDASLGEWMRKETIGLAFVMAYGHFLPKSVREASTHGMLNFHGSILPNYRGASPVETAIAMGETGTGVCLMRVAKEMDAGEVAACERVRIGNSDTSLDVRAKVGQAVVPLLRRNLQAALDGTLDFKPQDGKQATFCRKITKADGALDFTQSAAAIEARLRAFTPWPGGYFEDGAIRVKVGQCSVVERSASSAPGTVLAVKDSVDVATSEGVLRIHELQRPGGRMLPVPEFIRGYSLEVGQVLPSVPSEPLLSGPSIRLD